MPEPPQTRAVQVGFFTWLVVSALALFGYDWHAYHDDTPGNTISAGVWAAFDTPLKKLFLALALIASAAAMVAHFCLGWLQGAVPS